MKERATAIARELRELAGALEDGGDDSALCLDAARTLDALAVNAKSAPVGAQRCIQCGAMAWHVFVQGAGATLLCAFCGADDVRVQVGCGQTTCAVSVYPGARDGD